MEVELSHATLCIFDMLSLFHQPSGLPTPLPFLYKPQIILLLQLLLLVLLIVVLFTVPYLTLPLIEVQIKVLYIKRKQQLPVNCGSRFTESPTKPIRLLDYSKVWVQKHKASSACMIVLVFRYSNQR